MRWVRLKLIKESRPSWATRLISKEAVYEMLTKYYKFHDREEALVICLDNKNVPTYIHSLAVGSLNLCIVHPREVFKVALLTNASQIIFIHNHPSDDPTPSKEDQQITQRLVKGGDLIGIPLLDSLIVGGEKVISIVGR